MEPVSDNSNIINSILRITFAILFLVLIAELTYFFYIVPNKKVATNIISTPAPTLIPTPTVIAKKTPTPSIALIQEFRGKIVKISLGELETLPGDYKSVLRLSIEGQKDKNTITRIFDFAFSNEYLNKIKVIDLSDKPVSYNELKIGQNIKINFTQKNVKENISPNFEITILN